MAAWKIKLVRDANIRGYQELKTQKSAHFVNQGHGIRLKIESNRMKSNIKLRASYCRSEKLKRSIVPRTLGPKLQIGGGAMINYARCPECKRPMYKEMGFSLAVWCCEVHGPIDFVDQDAA